MPNRARVGEWILGSPFNTTNHAIEKGDNVSRFPKLRAIRNELQRRERENNSVYIDDAVGGLGVLHVNFGGENVGRGRRAARPNRQLMINNAKKESDI